MDKRDRWIAPPYHLQVPTVKILGASNSRHPKGMSRSVMRSFQFYSQPVPVAERSKARVYSRSLGGIVGSNPAGGMDGCPL